MKRLLLLLAIGMLFLSLSCSGGGTTPESRDLSGLEGDWILNGRMSGNMSGGGVTIPFDTEFQSDLVFTKTRITENGSDWTWDYNGQTLKLSDNYSESYYDNDLGDCQFTTEIEFYIDLPNYATSGTIKNGTCSFTLDTDTLGRLSGDLDVTGNIHK